MNLRIPHSYDTDGVIPDKIIISAYLGDKKKMMLSSQWSV